MESEDEIEEERRLCYVAITRAEKLLFITHAKIRTIYGSVSYCLPSRFIDEMPSDLIINNGSTNKSIRVKGGDNQKSKLIEIKDYRDREEKAKVEMPKPRNKVEKGELKVGTKVKHNKWGGIGMVVMIKIGMTETRKLP